MYKIASIYFILIFKENHLSGHIFLRINSVGRKQNAIYICLQVIKKKCQNPHEVFGFLKTS